MRKQSSGGFTLIEIMIAMAILAVISILSAQTMKAGIQDRETVSKEIASDSRMADALRVMRNDINSAYHDRDVFITIANNAQKPSPTATPAQPGAANDPSAPAPPAPPAPPAVPTSGASSAAEAVPTPRPTPPEVTGFIGDSNSLYFTTLSNQRTLQDSQVSDQAKIGYYVKSCKVTSRKQVTQSKCLYRSITPYLDIDVDKPSDDETVVLENVDEFKLRYLGPGQATTTELEYVETWKTGKNGDATTKDNFPYAVEVSLVTENKSEAGAKKVVASALIPIRFPNNPPKKTDGTPASNSDAAAAQAPTSPQPAGQPLQPPVSGNR